MTMDIAVVPTKNNQLLVEILKGRTSVSLFGYFDPVKMRAVYAYLVS